MKKYVVKVSSVFSNIIEVDAEDEDMARIKAKAFLENTDEKENPEKLRHYYESTFPPENWPVITQEKYEELKAQVKAATDEKAAEDHAPN